MVKNGSHIIHLYGTVVGGGGIKLYSGFCILSFLLENQIKLNVVLAGEGGGIIKFILKYVMVHPWAVLK